MDTALAGNGMLQVLIVEDESRIAGFLSQGLTERGFLCELADNGLDGLRLATSRQWDAVLLDVMLPGLDGLGVLRELRRAGQRAPVLLLTARDAVEDRVQGLNAGADDYVTKPFFIEEVAARLRALTRRSTGAGDSMLSAAGITLNRVGREVRAAGRPLTLTAREFALLECLLRSPGVVVTRTQILERVWEYHFDPQTNIVDVYIQRLRARLGDAGLTDVIETVRGVGYRLRTAPAEPVG